MSQAVGLLCQVLALACPPVPDVAAIQAAYDHEEAAGSKLHDAALQVLDAKCHDDGPEKYLCEVTFVSRKDPEQRLYFDIVAVRRIDRGWELKSGLCRR